jgi:hypothetical protein
MSALPPKADIPPPEYRAGAGLEHSSGNGTFHYVRVSDKAAWDELVGEYKIPTTAAGTASK